MKYKEVTVIEVNTYSTDYLTMEQNVIVIDEDGNELSFVYAVDAKNNLPFLVEGDKLKILYMENKIIAARK